ncbi:uncharacterized protein LOC133892851 isoform X2 [Phragmites australis]|uniref:uncharacterized protein LOC133892851 isoform X2 n=1 Tax=Phragmites australis TaxID=29695 RepID=UPI002D7689DC|nr:uncharacterized protein LOC133892851 isoform X2 [Phragmites australis]
MYFYSLPPRTPPPLAMPPLFASATATRFAAHWVADALAGDEALDFSVLKALVGASPECLAGAPEATRERVALRCLQEVASAAAASEGDAAATAGVLRLDAARSCEDLLLELIGEVLATVRSSGNLEKDMLPPFSQDIKNIICIKKPTLPETSFELLKEVDPEITSMGPSSQLEQNGTNQCDHDQSLFSSHDHVNIKKPRFPTDNAGFQQETSEDLVDETETRNLQKDPIAPTSVHQPCTSDSRSYDCLQEDIGAVGLGASSPEKSLIAEGNMPVGSVHASASCDTALQASITEPLSKQDTEDHATMVQPQSHREKSPNPPHHIDGERPHDGGASDQSSKDPSHEWLSMHATVAPAFDRSSDALPANASEPGHLPEFIAAQDTTMISQPHSRKTDLSALQHESGEKVNQDLDDVSASIQPVKKDHVHEEVTLQAASALPSVSCNGAIQGGKSETNHLPGNATEHNMVFEEQNGDKSHLEVSGADKVNQALHDDASILEKDTVHVGLNVQTVPMSQNCNIALHGKISEANYLSEQNTGKNRTDVQKCNSSNSVPNSAQDGDGKIATKTSNKKNLGDTFAEISHVPSSDDSLCDTAAAGLLLMINKMAFSPEDQDAKDSLGGMSQQDLCIKCGKDGQLRKCSGCLLAAHDDCFSSSVAFVETDLFYCPVCFYAKATEAYQKAKKTYCEARKNLAAFLGTPHLVRQHDEQLTGVLPRAANGEGHLNWCDPSMRKNIHQNEADNLAHRDEEPDQQRKKQKINATDSGHPKEVVTEKASPSQSADVAPMNKHSVLQSNSSKRVQDAEKQQQVESKEAGSGNSSHETRGLSQNRCGPSANQEVEADKEDDHTNSHQPDDSDEIEATSSNNSSGKRSSPLWRNMRHSKAGLQEKDTVVSSNSRKTITQQDQHIPSPSRKRNYAYPHKRYSNPVAPTGRRSKLCWTEEEEAALREAMAKFTPQDDGPIPWVQILECGRDVFHRTRLPCDLRVKWRNMKKKACP